MVIENGVLKITSAMANKLIRQIMDEKENLLRNEARNCTSSYVSGEAPLPCDYSYDSVRAAVQKCDEQVLKLKHAINLFNCSTVIDEIGITVDAALVKMRMLSDKKGLCDKMRGMKPLDRKTVFSGQTEFTQTNFDIKAAEQDYQRCSADLVKLQLGLDRVNNTVVFSVAMD